jgi:hypothetical protein
MCIKNTKHELKFNLKVKFLHLKKMHLARIKKKICNDFIQKMNKKILSRVKSIII